MTRLPIRWRLTVWYAALWLVTVVLLGAGLYAGTRAALYDDFGEQLQRQAGLAMSAVQFSNGVPLLSDSALANLRDDEHFVRLVLPDGRVQADTSDTVGGVALDHELIAAAMAGETRTTFAQADEGTLQIQTAPVHSGGEIVGVIQVGASRDDADELLELLLLGFGIAAPIALLLSGAGGYLLAGRALAPVASITALAANIEARDLSARLAMDLPDDELGRLARTFDAMLARIEDAFERQRRFTGDAAHELRTPLTFLRSQVDFALARPRSPEEYEEAFRGIDGDLERMTRLVGALLTLARADAGGFALNLEPVDLPGTITMLLEQYEPLSEAGGVSLVNAATPVRLTADADRLIQLLVNLLDNALAHTPAGGRIEVGCRAGGDEVRLWVEDSGEGIPPEQQERVFDRFHRVDSGRVRERGGVGLGLSICKTIAEAHGGTIAISTAEGGGTRVEVIVSSG